MGLIPSTPRRRWALRPPHLPPGAQGAISPESWGICWKWYFGGEDEELDFGGTNKILNTRRVRHILGVQESWFPDMFHSFHWTWGSKKTYGSSWENLDAHPNLFGKCPWKSSVWLRLGVDQRQVTHSSGMHNQGRSGRNRCTLVTVPKMFPEMAIMEWPFTQ